MCWVWLGRLWKEEVVGNDLFVAAAEEEDPHLLYSTDQHRLEIQEGVGEGGAPVYKIRIMFH